MTDERSGTPSTLTPLTEVGGANERESSAWVLG